MRNFSENEPSFMQNYFYVGIGIFLIIAFVSTRHGLQINQNDIVLKEDSEAIMIKTISKKMKGKSFENLRPTLSEGSREAIEFSS